jgi:MOSC domain-containing protein YiiM
MQLISVNIGHEQEIEGAQKLGSTGIYKLPVDIPVEVTPYGLAGDRIVDSENHGGLDQAVYIYGGTDYAWWAEILGKELSPGTFGENLTISDLESDQFQIGDRLQVGAVTLEATAPRIPCRTLAARMGDPAFAKRFRQAERPGLYCRVIETGWVQAGDPVSLERFTGGTITLLEMFRDYYERDLPEATLRRHLAAPIAIRARLDTEEQLRKLREAQG